MKSFVHAFVFVLAVTGAAATVQTTSASAKTNKLTAKSVSMLPVPMCAPDDPNACGMGTR
jgi:hypothetical protein